MTRLSRTLAVLLALAALAIPAMADDALSLVPANAVTVGMVKLSEMRTSPLSSLLFQHTDKIGSEGEAARFLFEAGLQPFKDVDTVVVATTPRTTLGSEADVLVVAEGRFLPQRLTAAIVARGGVNKGAYIMLPENEGENGAVAFVSSSLAIAGNERSVINALEARANGGTGFASRGALGMDLARIDRSATAWALVDVTRAARLAKGSPIETGKGPAADALRGALKTVSTVAMWAKDTGDTLQLGAFGLTNDTETLLLLEDTVRGALAAARIAVNDKFPDMVSVLRRFDVDRKSDSITVEGSIPATTLRAMMAKQLASASK